MHRSPSEEGEPFARDDLEELVECFLEEGLNTRVLTNGIGIPMSRIDRMIDAGLRDFSISLDSLYPARFDYICEHDGSWDEAVATMVHIGRRLHGVVRFQRSVLWYPISIWKSCLILFVLRKIIRVCCVFYQLNCYKTPRMGFELGGSIHPTSSRDGVA